MFSSPQALPGSKASVNEDGDLCFYQLWKMPQSVKGSTYSGPIFPYPNSLLSYIITFLPFGIHSLHGVSTDQVLGPHVGCVLMETMRRDAVPLKPAARREEPLGGRAARGARPPSSAVQLRWAQKALGVSVSEVKHPRARTY